jgi:hypothetical protein
MKEVSLSKKTSISRWVGQEPWGGVGYVYMVKYTDEEYLLLTTIETVHIHTY